jgi:hypothetical protein
VTPLRHSEYRLAKVAPLAQIDVVGGKYDVAFFRSSYDTQVSITFDQTPRRYSKTIRFVQIARGSKAGRSWTVDPNWTVDWQTGGLPYPYYPFNQINSVGFAGMSDAPGATWHNLHRYWQEFETCAFSIKSPQGKALGCVRWGQAFNRFGRAWDYGEGRNQKALDPTWDFTQLMQGVTFPEPPP